MVQLQPVRPDRSLDRRIVALAVVTLVALAGFVAGRQSQTPSTTPSPDTSASASPLTAAVTPAVLATPLVQPAIVPSDLASMAASVLAHSSWAVCETKGGIRCLALPSIELTVSEAAEVLTAWPRLTPVTLSAGELVVAAPSAQIDYALFASRDPGTRPTLVEPALLSGIAFLDLGPSLPAGQYVVMIARVPSLAPYGAFAAAALVVAK